MVFFYVQIVLGSRLLYHTRTHKFDNQSTVDRPLAGPMLTQIYDAIWLTNHMVIWTQFPSKSEKCFTLWEIEVCNVFSHWQPYIESGLWRHDNKPLHSSISCLGIGLSHVRYRNPDLVVIAHQQINSIDVWIRDQGIHFCTRPPIPTLCQPSPLPRRFGQQEKHQCFQHQIKLTDQKDIW